MPLVTLPCLYKLWPSFPFQVSNFCFQLFLWWRFYFIALAFNMNNCLACQKLMSLLICFWNFFFCNEFCVRVFWEVLHTTFSFILSFLKNGKSFIAARFMVNTYISFSFFLFYCNIWNWSCTQIMLVINSLRQFRSSFT